MPPEKEGDVFDRALAPFNHDDYDDESSTSQSESSSSVPSEKTSETYSRSSSSKSSSGSSSATPKRAQKRLSARERRIKSRKILPKAAVRASTILSLIFLKTLTVTSVTKAR